MPSVSFHTKQTFTPVIITKYSKFRKVLCFIVHIVSVVLISNYRSVIATFGKSCIISVADTCYNVTKPLRIQ